MKLTPIQKEYERKESFICLAPFFGCSQIYFFRLPKELENFLIETADNDELVGSLNFDLRKQGGGWRCSRNFKKVLDSPVLVIT